MTLLTVSQTTYVLDEHGFLEHPALWDEGFAEGIAPSIGIGSGLTEDHWRVIRYLRAKLEEGDVPFFVIACIDLGLKVSEFRDLFPTGFMRGACRAAGFSFAFIAEKNRAQTYENLSNVWMRYRLGPLGYLEDFDSWDETFVGLVASEWNLPLGLTEAHWKVIRFLRERYKATGKVPLVYESCQAGNLSLNEFYLLFPTGYWSGACRLAGLPFKL